MKYLFLVFMISIQTFAAGNSVHKAGPGKPALRKLAPRMSGQVYFNCKIISDVERSHIMQTHFTDVHKFSAIRGDVVYTDQLLVHVGRQTFQVPLSKAKRKRLAGNHEQIRVAVPQGVLALDFSGKAPVRMGTLEFRPTLSYAATKVKISCR